MFKAKRSRKVLIFLLSVVLYLGVLWFGSGQDFEFFCDIVLLALACTLVISVGLMYYKMTAQWIEGGTDD